MLKIQSTQLTTYLLSVVVRTIQFIQHSITFLYCSHSFFLTSFLPTFNIKILKKYIISIFFQDWEDYIYIDPLVVSSAVMWLLNYQTEEGSFVETEHYPHPLHKPMDGRSRFDGDYADMRNISLTAHVLISLEVTAPNLQGEQKKFSASARQRAVRYLERNLPKITDHYELAITAYALATSGSAESDLAYGQLRAIAREEGGMSMVFYTIKCCCLMQNKESWTSFCEVRLSDLHFYSAHKLIFF